MKKYKYQQKGNKGIVLVNNRNCYKRFVTIDEKLDKDWEHLCIPKHIILKIVDDIRGGKL